MIGHSGNKVFGKELGSRRWAASVAFFASGWSPDVQGIRAAAMGSESYLQGFVGSCDGVPE